MTYTGNYDFAQTAGGTNYWNPGAPYLSGTVSNAPPASDIIALARGGTNTITFSQAVLDPIIALVSWNGVTANFSAPIDLLSSGCGFWACGTFGAVTATGFTGSGELHGAIRLTGSFTSITFTDTAENWHGLTIGVVDLGGPVGVRSPGPWRCSVPDCSASSGRAGAGGPDSLNRGDAASETGCRIVGGGQPCLR